MTHVMIVRPVTATGDAASGFTVKSEHGGSVDCSAPGFASPGAVDANIQECSPSAEYAIACWMSSTPKHVLCSRDPSSNQLYSIKLTGGFANVESPAAAQRAPLIFVLRDGAKCSIRDGGAWGVLKSHPRWAGSYSCDKHGVVWAPAHSHHYGINESKAVWTVHTAAANGTRAVKVRKIKRAIFVGTSS